MIGFDEKSIEKTDLDGVFKIKLEKFFDDRGFVLNIYKNNTLHFNQEKLTVSKKNVLRGLHSDTVNDKLIYCLRGSFKLVVVNFIEGSDQYMRKTEFLMNEESNYAVFVPKNFLNGHYCLEDNTYFYYKWSSGYVMPDEQISVNWSSPSLSIDWGLLEKEPILSDRDRAAIIL
jgi:dTDP-4-dehydrorhamnose 3,5-epimerase